MNIFSKHTHTLHPDDVRFCIQTIRLLAARSRAMRARVGCVIWDNNKRTIVSVGYNGTPPGEDNTMEVDNVTRDVVIHAEDNALRKLYFWQSWNKVLFVTHSPCAKCAQLILKRGIRQVYYLDNYGSSTGITMLREAGVTVIRLILG